MTKKLTTVVLLTIFCLSSINPAWAIPENSHTRMVRQLNLIISRHNLNVKRFLQKKTARCPLEKFGTPYCRRLFKRIVREQKHFERQKKKFKRRLKLKNEIPDTIASQSVSQLALKVLELVNQTRAKVNESALTLNPLLSQAAQKHAEDMNNRSYFNHVSPEGIPPGQRIETAGYLKEIEDCQCSYRYLTGENIAWGSTTAEEIVRGWIDSPPHYENLIRPEFTEMGFGYINSYAVQTFGTIEKN